MSDAAEAKRYLVTGAAGFIASRVCELLLDAGHEVAGVDNMNDYYDVRIKERRRDALTGRPGFSFVKGDIESLDLVESLFDDRGFDAVFNLAARAGVRYSLENPHVYLSTNAQGTLNLLETMRRRGVKKFVLASTSSLYAGQPAPFVETLPVNTPISPYAASKKAAEALAYSYRHLYGVDVSVVRYFTVYGPAGRPDMSVFRFIKWIDEGAPLTVYGDGEQSRDFTYVDDIARGTIAAARPLGYEIVNLGGGKEPVTLNALIKAMERALAKEAVIDRQPAHSADMRSTQADNSKALRLLGWRPETSLEVGVEKTIAWYRANRDWLRDIPV